MHLSFFDGKMVQLAKDTQIRFGCYEAARFMQLCGFPFEFTVTVLECTGRSDTAEHCWVAYQSSWDQAWVF